MQSVSERGSVNPFRRLSGGFALRNQTAESICALTGCHWLCQCPMSYSLKPTAQSESSILGDKRSDGQPEFTAELAAKVCRYPTRSFILGCPSTRRRAGVPFHGSPLVAAWM